MTASDWEAKASFSSMASICLSPPLVAVVHGDAGTDRVHEEGRRDLPDRGLVDGLVALAGQLLGDPPVTARDRHRRLKRQRDAVGNHRQGANCSSRPSPPSRLR